jgi:hypothetical protein
VVASSAAHGALESLGEVAGVGASLLPSIQMLFAAGTSFVVAMLARRAVPTGVTEAQEAIVSLH